jgi:hypothetical protein
MNSTVDRKVTDLYKNILNNFNKTILPYESEPKMQISDNQLVVESRRAEQQMLKEVIGGKIGKKLPEDDKENRVDKDNRNSRNKELIQPQVTKAKMCPVD